MSSYTYAPTLSGDFTHTVSPTPSKVIPNPLAVGFPIAPYQRIYEDIYNIYFDLYLEFPEEMTYALMIVKMILAANTVPYALYRVGNKILNSDQETHPIIYEGLQIVKNISDTFQSATISVTSLFIAAVFGRLFDEFDESEDEEVYSQAVLGLFCISVTASVFYGYNTAKSAAKSCYASSKFSYLGVRECVSTAKNAFFGFIYGNSNNEELSAVESPGEDSEYDAPRMVI